MDKYLISILKEINTIIIPGIGALTITNKETGEIMFMPYLKHEDGTLARYIAEKEGWDENTARNLIAKYVREIEAKLNVGDTYDMFQFGSFRKDSSGDLIFEQCNNGSSAKPNEIEKTEMVVETITEPVINVEPEEIVTEVVETEYVPEPEVLKEPEVATLEIEVGLDTAPGVPKEGAVSIEDHVESPIYTEEQQWNDDLDLPPINATIERPKKPILEKAKPDRKRRSLPVLPLLIFLVILVGGGSVLVVFWDDLSGKKKVVTAEDKFKETVAKEKSEVAESAEETQEDQDNYQEEIDQTSAEETEEIQEVIAPVDSDPKPSDQITTSTGTVFRSLPFHIIAGAFAEQANAERFRDKLRESGSSNAEIIGKFDGLYLVSSGSYSSETDAQSERSKQGGRSWIFQWP
jgi:hypothetical protein